MSARRRGCWPEAQHRDLGRREEAHGPAGLAQPGRDEQVAPALDLVAAGVALAEPRRQERAADERHADLAAVQVAGHGERDTVGHLGEHVRVVVGR